MDAFAVSVSNGMCYRMPLWKNMLSSGAAFGFFQGLMPLAGYFAGHSFSRLIESVDHWIALILLGFIGGRMVYTAARELKKDACEVPPRTFSVKTLCLQAVATSIDALAVGVSLGIMQVNIWLAAGFIALITLFMSAAGVVIGKFFGKLLAGKAEILGGVILIIIGVHIFLEHMFF